MTYFLLAKNHRKNILKWTILLLSEVVRICVSFERNVLCLAFFNFTDSQHGETLLYKYHPYGSELPPHSARDQNPEVDPPM